MDFPRFLSWFFRIFLITFGQPRVGNYKYAQIHDALVNNSWRIVHKRDLVSLYDVYEIEKLIQKAYAVNTKLLCFHTMLMSLTADKRWVLQLYDDYGIAYKIIMLASFSDV